MVVSPVPKINLSMSVKNHLTGYIRNAFAQGNEKLPSENVIAESLGVSRITLRRALSELERDGMILRHQGRGTFINPEALKIQANLVPGEEFRNLIKDCGYNPSVEVVNIGRREPSVEEKETLGLADGEALNCIEKLYLASGHPAIISIDCFSEHLIDTKPEAGYLAEHSVFELLRECAGVVIERDRIAMETLTRAEAREVAASAARIECESALLFSGVNYDQSNRPVMVDTEIYNTNYVRFGLMRVKNAY